MTEVSLPSVKQLIDEERRKFKLLVEYIKLTTYLDGVNYIQIREEAYTDPTALREYQDKQARYKIIRNEVEKIVYDTSTSVHIGTGAGAGWPKEPVG